VTLWTNNMPVRQWKRTFRAGKMTPAEAARDRKLRGLIQAEFPPLVRPPIPRSLSAGLKKAMKHSRKTSYQLAREAGLSPILVSRFLSGQRDIRLATADRLAHVLGLKLIAG
jgi:transcriptional regulator with XRE-family HTH domain